MNEIGFDFIKPVKHIKRMAIKQFNARKITAHNRKFHTLSVRQPTVLITFKTAYIIFNRAIAIKHKRQIAVYNHTLATCINIINLRLHKLKGQNRVVDLVCAKRVKNIKTKVAVNLKTHIFAKGI